MKLTNLTPLLETDNLKETIEFYTENLGFVCESVYPDNGTPCWANLQKDVVTLMFSLKSPHTRAEKPIVTYPPLKRRACWVEPIGTRDHD